MLSLEDALTKIECGRDRGVFSIIRKADGSEVLRDAGAGVNRQSLAGPAKRMRRLVAVPLSGDRAEGALGIDPAA